MSSKEAWFKDLKIEAIKKRVGRRIEPENVVINKTSIAFGTKLISVFEEAKSIQIDQIFDKDKLLGLVFSPKNKEGEGYTIRTPEDRKAIQMSLPKTLRPIFEKRGIFGEYKGEIFENASGYEGLKIVAIRF